MWCEKEGLPHGDGYNEYNRRKKSEEKPYISLTISESEGQRT
jgi:hypothetical protein